MDQLPNSEKPPASSVWPPPATGVPTIRLRPGFISLRNMVLPIGILVSLGVLLELVTTILGLVPQTGQVEAVNSLAGSVSSIVYLLQSILYFIWLYRAYGNLNAFFTAGQSFTPGWAVGWYFVPIFNLFRPYSAMVELWRASSPAVDSSVEAEWRSLPNPKIVNTWWIVFILDNVVWLLLIPTFFLHATHPAYSDFAAIVNGVTGSAELILEFRVVRGLTDLQEQKEQAMISADRGEGA